MKKFIFIFLIFVNIISFAASRNIFNIRFLKPDFQKELFLKKSWDYKNPVKLRYDSRGVFEESYELEKHNFYFIELIDSENNFYYAYKFTLKDDEKLEVDLGFQKVTIKAFKPTKLKLNNLNVYYDDNLIPMVYNPNKNIFETDIDLPVNKKIDLYLKDDSKYIFGPIKYESDNAYQRDVEIDLL